ncbi:MarR family transcriptional regulator [Curtobacterium sp. MCLR17_054]|uniref:MarR family winged helix-turn-helix transcriptional regulator n=1 Tax=Curtobacterium sp. MCLR17_054 TaxID=2175632 RepID=UPI000DA9A0E7|nr:MarR family transcriptional regulator [Curtobacterium sp. MCLR17_054]WIE70333.1 MarR family transcriptional regulator [Curtobacterium sp. MCLR17_054]
MRLTSALTGSHSDLDNGMDERNGSTHAVLEALLQLHLSYNAALERICAAAGTNTTAAAALREIISAERLGSPLGRSDLALILCISTPSVTTLLHTLEEAGLAVRVPHPTDRRCTLIRSTPSLNAGLVALDDRIKSLAATLAPEDAHTITRFFNHVSDVLENPH